MIYRDMERGVDQNDQASLKRILSDLEAEIRSIPGSQFRTTIDVDTLVQLIRAAKDGLMARPLFDALEPARQELEEIGRSRVVSVSMGRVIANFLELHPEIEDQE